MGTIRVGTSGYSFGGWKGIVYPATVRSDEMFSYYLHRFGFNTVEINYTYYRLPSVRTTASFAEKSPGSFDFTVKLFGGITHDPWRASPPTEVDTGLCAQFLEGVKPLRESGKLGCILAQFPPTLSRSPLGWDYVQSLAEAFEDIPLVYEFRNRGWASEETVRKLRQAGIGFCAVDEPHVGVLMPLVPAVTSDIAYLRLHGRNHKWFEDPSQRYDYLYNREELTQLLPAIRSMASRSRVMYIAFNNCHVGAAVRNAKMMQEILDSCD